MTRSERPLTPAAIFDVDGTICNTRSTACLGLVWLRGRQHTRWRHALWIASCGWRLPLLFLNDQFSRDRADRQVCRQFAGLSQRRAVDDARACTEHVLLPACFPDALREMEEHRAAGRRVVFVSGGVDVVLKPLAETLGAELLAQRLEAIDDRLTGAHLGYAAFGDSGSAARQGARKAAALARYAAETGIDLTTSIAYGDSVNDVAMLALVGTAFVVRPDRRLRRIAERRGWDVKRWGN